MAKEMAAGRWRGQAKDSEEDKARKDVPKPYMSAQYREDTMHTTGRGTEAHLWGERDGWAEASLASCASCQYTKWSNQSHVPARVQDLLAIAVKLVQVAQSCWAGRISCG